MDPSLRVYRRLRERILCVLLASQQPTNRRVKYRRLVEFEGDADPPPNSELMFRMVLTEICVTNVFWTLLFSISTHSRTMTSRTSDAAPPARPAAALCGLLMSTLDTEQMHAVGKQALGTAGVSTMRSDASSVADEKSNNDDGEEPNRDPRMLSSQGSSSTLTTVSAEASGFSQKWPPSSLFWVPQMSGSPREGGGAAMGTVVPKAATEPLCRAASAPMPVDRTTLLTADRGAMGWCSM